MSGAGVILLTVREGREVAILYPPELNDVPCGAVSPITYRRAYTCTRAPHVEGPHIAHLPDGSAVALWTRVAPAVPRLLQEIEP